MWGPGHCNAVCVDRRGRHRGGLATVTLCVLTGEADIVAAHVEQLVQAGLAPQDIAVIAPYNLQVGVLALCLPFSGCHHRIKNTARVRAMVLL